MTIKLTFGYQQPGEVASSMDPNWLTMTFCMGNKGVNAQQKRYVGITIILISCD